MEDSQTQEKVERARRALQSEWNGSIEILRQYAKDEAEEVRLKIYGLYWQTGISSTEAVKRASIVEFMLDKTIEETPLLRGQLLAWLQDFWKEDFTERSRAKLNSLPWNEDYAPEAIRLIGIADIREPLPRLNEQIRLHPLSEKQTPPSDFQENNTWAALLALARMGENSALSEVISRVQQEGDKVTQATILFYDLGYTRRPAAFDLLKKYINSDERLPRFNDRIPGTMIASNAAEVFSKHIRGFPIHESIFNYQDTMRARAWVNAQTSWQFK